jgi:putative copper export protein
MHARIWLGQVMHLCHGTEAASGSIGSIYTHVLCLSADEAELKQLYSWFGFSAFITLYLNMILADSIVFCERK